VNSEIAVVSTCSLNRCCTVVSWRTSREFTNADATVFAMSVERDERMSGCALKLVCDNTRTCIRSVHVSQMLNDDQCSC